MALLADILTLSRVPMGLAVIYAGVSNGQAALPQVIWLSLLSWTVDSLDGHLKRASAKPPGWIGRNDLNFDVFFNGCVAVFFTVSGFVSAAVLSLWVGALGFIRLKLRSRSGTVAANAVVVLTLLVNAFQHALILGGAITGWACVALALDRKRFAYRLQQFVSGLRPARIPGDAGITQPAIESSSAPLEEEQQPPRPCK